MLEESENFEQLRARANAERDYEYRFQLIEQINELALKLNNPEYIATALLERVELRIYRNEFEFAKEDVEAAINIAERTSSDFRNRALMSGYNKLGVISWKTQHHSEACAFFFRAIPHAKTLNDLEFEANLHSNIGLNLEEQGDVAGAIREYKHALALVPDKTHIRACALYNLATLCRNLLDFTSARAYLDEAITCSITGLSLKIHVLNLSSMIFTREGKASDAILCANEAVQLSHDFHSQQHLCVAYCARAEAFASNGEKENALLDFNTALTHSRYDFRSCYILLHIAKIFAVSSVEEKGGINTSLDQAHSVMSRASELLKQLNDVARMQCLELLSEIEALLGNMNAAYNALKEQHDLTLKYYPDKIRNEISSLRLLMQLEREEHEKELERMKREQTEKELSNSTLQLIAQTELLEELRGSLTALIRKLPAGNEVAKELHEKLRNLPCKSVDWERFDTQFKAAHPEFTQKLTTQYSELSPTEIRICSLVRMNLKSEEIARLFCLSARTIENHRYNIRKKMELAEGADLMKELMKL